MIAVAVAVIIGVVAVTCGIVADSNHPDSLAFLGVMVRTTAAQIFLCGAICTWALFAALWLLSAGIRRSHERGVELRALRAAADDELDVDLGGDLGGDLDLQGAELYPGEDEAEAWLGHGYAQEDYRYGHGTGYGTGTGTGYGNGREQEPTADRGEDTLRFANPDQPSGNHGPDQASARRNTDQPSAHPGTEREPDRGVRPNTSYDIDLRSHPRPGKNRTKYHDPSAHRSQGKCSEDEVSGNNGSTDGPEPSRGPKNRARSRRPNRAASIEQTMHLDASSADAGYLALPVRPEPGRFGFPNIAPNTGFPFYASYDRDPSQSPATSPSPFSDQSTSESASQISGPTAPGIDTNRPARSHIPDGIGGIRTGFSDGTSPAAGLDGVDPRRARKPVSE